MNLDSEIYIEIVEYLSGQFKCQDSLNGIIFGVFKKEFDRYSEKIIKNLGDLISIGVVTESTDEKDNSVYKLVIKPAELSKYLPGIVPAND